MRRVFFGRLRTRRYGVGCPTTRSRPPKASAFGLRMPWRYPDPESKFLSRLCMHAELQSAALATCTLRPEHRGLEIGWTWLSSSAWGTSANVEAKLLLLEHAFERLGCQRVEFKTDARNERSRAALSALPARFEGIFRKHMLVRDGERRDSAYYSIVDDEWPEVGANLRRRLRGLAERRTTRGRAPESPSRTSP